MTASEVSMRHRNMRWLRNGILLSVGLAICTGCMPSPGYHRLTPAFTGVVLHANRPVSGAIVALSYSRRDSSCAQSTHQVTTDESGSFEISAVEEFRFIELLFGDTLYEWYVCITEGSSRFAGHSGGSVGRVPERITLRCDLPTVPKEANSEVCVPRPAASTFSRRDPEGD